jgi:flagellar motility protein MotE (MotC chaperone)
VASQRSEGAREGSRASDVAATRSRTGPALRWLVVAALIAKLGVAAIGVRGATAAPDAASPSSAAASAAAAAQRSTSLGVAAVTPPASRPGERPRPGDVHALLSAITERQAQLDARTRDLDAREERLQLYETDVTRKLEQLEAIEKRLKASAEAQSASGEQGAASIAKVYGAMPAAKAAPILEQLDDATVLRILARMKEKEIGQILPLMTRERAIVLTRSLAGR